MQNLPYPLLFAINIKLMFMYKKTGKYSMFIYGLCRLFRVNQGKAILISKEFHREFREWGSILIIHSWLFYFTLIGAEIKHPFVMQLWTQLIEIFT